MIRRRMQDVDANQGYPIASASDNVPFDANRIARADRDAGHSKPPPVQISPKPRPQHADPVRTVGIVSHVAEPSGASRRALRSRASRDFIAGRRPSASSAITPSSRSRAGTASASSRRSSVASGQRTGTPAPGEVTQHPPHSPSPDLHASMRPRLEPRAPLHLLNASERSSTSCLADFLRDTGPECPPAEFAKNSGPESSSANAASASAARRLRLDDMDCGPAHEPLDRTNNSPQAYSESSSTDLEPWQVAPPALPAATGIDSLAPPAVSARVRKRWTFNGFTTTASPTGDLALAAGDRTIPSPTEQSEAIPANSSRRYDAPHGTVAQDYVVDTSEQVSPTRDQLSPTLRKRRSVCSLPDRTDRRALEKHDKHAVNLYPASQSTASLEFLKLARSRNAQLVRAIETRKKTYLAILGGEEGDRIELYTGSKQISLSLNRTFVLPDAPRSIELQLQGDDLVDIYLIYADSIFALEPATVRVREVGIGRDERRSRQRQRDEEDSREPSVLESRPRTSSQRVRRRSTADEPPSYPQPASESRENDSRVKRDFSGFQQLAFIPPVPSHILAPSWIIPPLYTDVMGDGEPPLLSPVSLLSGAALRNNGRPGLFFCSTGAHSTAIVTAEGRNGA